MSYTYLKYFQKTEWSLSTNLFSGCKVSFFGVVSCMNFPYRCW